LFFWYTYRISSHFWNIRAEASFCIIYLTTICIGAILSWYSHLYVESTGIRLGKKLMVKIQSEKN
jgi:peptidoglycan/LPS O-acetylase OafA/YrhL